MSRIYLPFRFKKFEVAQDKCAMKVGTDGVLLGAWAGADGENILDIGTGTGLVALMLAQKNPKALIDAIDINPQSISQALENFTKSPWAGNLTAIKSDIKTFESSKKYDIIVTNPPYFKSGTIPPTEERYKARHATELTFTDLLKSVNHLLKPKGEFSIILPYKEGIHFINIAEDFNLYPKYITEFVSRPGKAVERLLLTFTMTKAKPKKTSLLHYINEKEWSAEYINLTRDYYIIL